MTAPKQKPTQKRSSKARAAPASPGPVLAPTETPGVFRNGSGVLVNSKGIMLSLLEAKKADTDDMAAVLGRAVATPADVLTAAALDPRLPLATRLDAAHKAAPYTDRKKPTALDGGVGEDGKPLPVSVNVSFPPEVLAAMSDAELAALTKALSLLGAVGAGSPTTTPPRD